MFIILMPVDNLILCFSPRMEDYNLFKAQKPWLVLCLVTLSFEKHGKAAYRLTILNEERFSTNSILLLRNKLHKDLALYA